MVLECLLVKDHRELDRHAVVVLPWYQAVKLVISLHANELLGKQDGVLILDLCQILAHCIAECLAVTVLHAQYPQVLH